MLPLTIFLARLFGLYCLIVATAMLIRKEETIRTLDGMVLNRGQVMIAGVIALGVGLATVLGHNIWSGGALPIGVTLVGWTATLKGIWLLVSPTAVLKRSYSALNYRRLYTFYMGLTLVLGVALFWGSLRG
jgi:hypothetical protein